MSNLIRFGLSPAGLAVALMIGALWRWRCPSAAAPRRFLVAVAAVYWLSATYAVDFVLGRIWMFGSHPFSQADVPPGTTAEVVLGSGSFTARDWTGNKFSIVDRAGAMRVLEAVRVYNIAKPAWVISSGGLIAGQDGLGASGAVTMKEALVRLGVPADRILMETMSRNTRDEGVIIRPMLKALNVDHVIVVTSELHMRRSIGVFRAVGIEAIPAKARGVFATLPWISWVLPSTQGLTEAGFLYHEVLGVPYYRLHGWYK